MAEFEAELSLWSAPLLLGEPRRLRWDFAHSPWNAAHVIVEYGEDDGVTCYAPPGASLDGEHGVELACWRRATWARESLFFERRDPTRVERLPTARVRALLPSDFHGWAETATAAHVARLRTLQELQPDASVVADASTVLLTDLDRAFPRAFERYSCAREAAASEAETDAAAAADATAPGSRLDWRTMGRRGWAAFLAQLASLVLVYLAYRLLLRPEIVAENPRVRLATVLESSPRDVLLWSYGLIHVPVTLGLLVWVYFRHHRSYPFVRTTVVLGALLAVAVSRLEWLLSGVPVYAAGVQDRVPPIAVPMLPVMHLATALLLGACGALLAGSALARVLWLAYPLLVGAVIVATPPTWLLPTLAAGVTLSALAWLLMELAGRVRHSWRQPPEVGQRLRAIRADLLRSPRTLGGRVPALRSRA